MLDVSIASEHPFEIHPLTLDVDPNIEEHMDTIKSVLPGRCFFFELLVVRRVSHGLQIIQVFAALSEKFVPALYKTALILVVDQLQGVVVPDLADLLDKFFQSVLAARLVENVSYDLLAGPKLEIPYITQRHGSRRIPLLGPQLLENLDPMTFAYRVSFQISENCVLLQKLFESILHMIKSLILAELSWHSSEI